MSIHTHAVPKVKKKTKKEKNTKSYWKEEADKWFSRWVRKLAANFQGKCQCVTCGKWFDWEDLQNGHYESRGTHILRYDPRNAHPQCVSCNIFKHGNYQRYTIFMLKTYGEALLMEFEEQSKHLIQRTAKDYQVIAEYYKKLFEEL